MARCTRSRVASLTPAVPLSTAETVAFETPACRATSVMVGRLAVMGRSWRGALRKRGGREGSFLLNEIELFDAVRLCSAADDTTTASGCQEAPGTSTAPS